MKKNYIAANWVIAISVVLVSLVLVSADANAQFFSRTLSFRDLSTELKTPEAVAHYMWKNFVFERDQRQFGVEEYWQSPEKMLVSGKGDCEDFALFAAKILKTNGLHAFVFNIYGNGYGHSVCLVLENGNYSVIDGDRVIPTGTKNLREVAYQIYPFWTKAAVVGHVSNGKAKALKTIER